MLNVKTHDLKTNKKSQYFILKRSLTLNEFGTKIE